MGIPAYFAFLIRNYKGIDLLKGLGNPKEAAQYDHLFMDCNSVVYDAYRQLLDAGEVVNTDSVVRKVISILEDHVNFIRPSKTVFIAFDGIAPFAKMVQQRERRFRVSSGAGAAAASFGMEAAQWNTIMITAGTDFMNILSESVERHFCTPAVKPEGIKYIVSSSNKRGEGEHKIFHYLRQQRRAASTTSVDRIDATDKIIVYGLDADLIMLSLNHLYLGNPIYIFRESMEFKEVVTTKETKYNLLDIGSLSNQIGREVGASARDYIFLCFLLGNDFLPHFPALNLRSNGMNILLETYKSKKPTQRVLVDPATGKVQWRNLRAILADIAAREHEIFIGQSNERDKVEKRLRYSPLTDEERELNAPVLNREMEKYICPAEEGWEARYYRVLFGFESTEKENIRAVVMNYLEGLEWTLKYYGGECPDWKWSYKYHYPPLLVDLIKYIPHFEMEFFSAGAHSSAASAAEKSFAPEVQLAAVLPRAQLHILSPQMRRILENTGDIDRLYPRADQIKTIWAFCRYNWESHLDLPEITVEKMEEWSVAAAKHI